MSKGAFGYTDSKSDHCELRVNRAGESPMSKGVFEYTDFKNDYCELRSSAQRLPSSPHASPYLTFLIHRVTG